MIILLTYDKTINYWKTKHTSGSYSAIKTNKDRHVAKTKLIIRRFSNEINQCKSICELGCGNGRNLYYLSQQYSHIKYYGNDIDLNLFQHIKATYPELLNNDNVKITQEDTLAYLEALSPVDMIFTYGHLMHIPDDIIIEVCNLISQKAKKFILLYEAFIDSIKLSQEKKERYKNYRFGRDYNDMFPGFDLIVQEFKQRQGLYLFERATT